MDNRFTFDEAVEKIEKEVIKNCVRAFLYETMYQATLQAIAFLTLLEEFEEDEERKEH